MLRACRGVIVDALWVDAGGGYGLALSDGKLICRNKKGKVLASVPAKVRKGEIGQQLIALRDWLALHERDCAVQVTRWMLRSLPVPASLIASVWDDPAWSRHLADLVVHPVDDPTAAGLLRAADAERGLGVVDLDGETEWLDADRIRIAHPILLEDLDDWRELASELEVTQAVSQLYREVHVKPDGVEGHAVKDYADGHFEALQHVFGRCRTLGIRVSGGYAVQPVWEDGHVVEARYWIGAHDPEFETETGDLHFMVGDAVLPLAEVPPVTWSEGHRMAASVFAKRVVKNEEEDA
jgi:hypothetical protein